MDYTLCGDYRLPNLLPTQEEEHDKFLFINLLTAGKLNEHVAEVDTRAQTMGSMLVKKIAEQEGINETLKEEDQIEWVKRMNSIRSRVKEIIWNEIVWQQKSIGKFFADAFFIYLCVFCSPMPQVQICCEPRAFCKYFWCDL